MWNAEKALLRRMLSHNTRTGDRIGLAFSHTIPLMTIQLDHIALLNEIEHNGYCFSDGCGVMGCTVAYRVKDQLGLQEPPSAIQVRIGGVKGML